jgi:ubiquinone/menaquinone biosynthesis C-methylase UbiE
MHERRFAGDISSLRSPERVERLEVHRVVQLCMEGGSFRTMLDVGTGSGLFAEEFAAHKLTTTGIDANPLMLSAARRAFEQAFLSKPMPGCQFVQAIAEDPPFATGSFDLAFYGLVLHEADDALKVLQGAHRLCRQRVCVLEWPYREQTYGPPLTERLSPAKLEELYQLAGFHCWKRDELNHMDLYRLDR